MFSQFILATTPRWILPPLFLTAEGSKLQRGFVCLFFGVFFCRFRVTLVAYWGSQARGRIGAIAAGLHHSHSTQGPSHVCGLHHSPQQWWILNPLSEGRDRIHNLMVPSQIHFCCTTTGTPREVFYQSKFPSWSGLNPGSLTPEPIDIHTILHNFHGSHPPRLRQLS